MSATPADYAEHCILFVDLLGFSEQTFGDDEKTAAVLQALSALQQNISDFEFKQKQVTPWLSVPQIQPAVSAFSDHMVVSFRLAEMFSGSTFPNGGADIRILSQMQQFAARLAAQALGLGFLIRGAVTVGNLYHHSGVVFGEALVEAYRLESEVAVYPRILLSQKLVADRRFRPPPWLAQQDFDGLYHLPYLDPMLMALQGGIANWQTDLREALQPHMLMIQSKIESFHQGNKPKPLMKWHWFKNRLDQRLREIETRHEAS